MAKGWDKFIEDRWEEESGKVLANRWDEFFDELVDEIQEVFHGEISKKEAGNLIIHWMKT